MTEEVDEDEAASKNSVVEITKHITRCICFLAAIAGAVALIVSGHVNEPGWEFLILLAFVLTI